MTLLVALALPGCALTGGAGNAPQDYLLNVEFPVPGKPAPEDAPVILVAQPRAASGFETRNMIYLKQPNALRAYADNRWAAPPADMLRTLVVAALESTGAFAAVVDAGSGFYGELRLDLELLKLQQEFFDRPSRIRLVLRATLVDNVAGKILATRTIELTEPALGNDPQSGVAAANRAVKEALEEIAAMAAEYARKESMDE